MSVIACKIMNNSFMMVADSYFGDDGSNVGNKIKGGKLSVVRDYVIGFVGYATDNSLLIHFCDKYEVIEQSKKGVQEFVIEFYKFLKDLGRDDIIKSEDRELEFLIAIENKVYWVCDLSVKEITTHFAIGEGRKYARAALHLGHSPVKAVEVACDLSIYCSKPVVVSKGIQK